MDINHLSISKLLPDKLFIKLKFRKIFGHFPDIANPITFNEKLNWLKLHDRSSLHTICADKYRSRTIIRKIIGDKYLIPLEFQTYEVNDIGPEILPNYPVVIKSNLDCGGMIFVWDKNSIDWNKTRGFFKKCLKKNHYYYSREWQYKNIIPCIIVEKLLLDEDGKIPNDYKVYCFNGVARFIAVDQDKGTDTQARNWYDTEWNKHDINFYMKGDNRLLKRPSCLDTMISCSQKLAEDFKFLRVDWYVLNEKIFIGELTFHPGGAMIPFYPNKWDNILGDYLDLK